MADANANDLAVLSNRLNQLQTQLDEAIVSARRKNMFSFVVTIIGIILIAVYLWFGYNKYGSIDPTFAAELAHGQVNSFLPTAAEQLRDNLRTDAPRVVDNLQQHAQELPGRFATELETQADTEMDKQMPAVQDSLYHSMKDKLTAPNPGSGKSNEQQFQDQLNTLTEVYKDETIKLADQVHSQYVSSSGDPLTTLQTLADNKNLTPREQVERDLMRDGLTLKRIYDSEAKNASAGAASGATDNSPTAQAGAVAPTTMPTAQ